MAVEDDPAEREREPGQLDLVGVQDVPEGDEELCTASCCAAVVLSSWFTWTRTKREPSRDLAARLVPMPLAFWVCAAITAISATVSLGYSIAGLASAAEPGRTPSMYALARSVALTVVAVAAFFVGSVPFLAAVAIAMVVVQAADAVIGGLIHDRLKTIGPAATAAAHLAVLVWLWTAAG